jgi:hypothetical protein
MSRAYIIYFLMFAVLVGGLWLIITVGAAMKAPDDLSGDWKIAWYTTPPPELDVATMKIQQSGRFFTIQFGDRKPISMSLVGGWHGARDGRRLQMHLVGAAWKMDITAGIPLRETWHVPEASIALSGPYTASATATRVGAQTARTSTTSPPPAGGVANAR